MSNTFVNPVLTKSSELGISLYEDSQPVELYDHDSPAETEVVIRAVYRQVLGNAHIMESERLTISESQLSNGDITVKEFIRHVAKSELYRSLFFDKYSSPRLIELNFKHLLGRAPDNYEEVAQHSQILTQEGFEAEIDSYLDSAEYLENFGDNTVPYYQGYKTQTGKNVAGFTHLFSLLRGSCSSDRSSFKGTKPRLQKALIDHHPSSMIPLSRVAGDWQKTDVNQLLSTTLNIPAYQQVSSNSQFRNQAISPHSRSTIWQNQYNAFQDYEPLELIPGSSQTELETIISAVYKQVLGNAHIMESERLTVPESQLKRGDISVREFVRWVAKSKLYKSRFIDNCPRYRSHELNFKHLLGRAPDDYQETFAHSQILDRQGYEADIDSYIDSDEYQEAFGENIVPYYRGYKTQTGKRLLGYTNMFKMLESVSTSDKAGASANTPRLVKPLIYNNPDGNVPVTDISDLLQGVLRPKTQTKPATSGFVPYMQSQSTQSQQEREEEALTKEIADLEAKLAELRSFATIGAAGVSKWQSSYIDINAAPSSSGSSSSWGQTNNSPTNQERVEALKQEIAQARSLAALGESRLNKWRSRVFY